MLQKFDERNRDLIVNINGELVHRDQARISPFDSSVQGGDAVWEGLRLYNGRIFRLEQPVSGSYAAKQAILQHFIAATGSSVALAEGSSVKEIAGHLKLSIKTVDAHKNNLMKKLDIHDRTHLVRYAIRRKLVEL